ncbi:MAG: tRNA 4-thiouridine(8) synthase ThiI [Candidatus Altiarchaeales archaeon]|nr:tRNA 4-thiouridine(8) synthase ThiI [Candidatus Altiarchaeales archaeon]
MLEDCVIVRYGEIALKGGNRSMFEKKLSGNMKIVLETNSIQARIEKISGRFIVEPKNAREAAQIISGVFGVTSTSPGFKVKAGLQEIKEKALEVFNASKPNSFRITANRLEKTFKETSMEVNNIVGEFIQEKTKCRVSLKNPELDIGVDITKDNAYIYTERFEGVGGLPAGVSGKVVCLLSGGIDSPVAAWLALKRGCDVTLLHFLHEERNKRPGKIQELKEKLCKYHPDIKLVYIPTKEIEKEIIMKVPAKMRIVILRRIFMKIASKLANEMNARAIITGDNIGQVASQTLDNLNVIDKASGILTIRPLAGLDKREIIDLAKKIGTYETSIQEYKDCCNFLLPKHPETKAKLMETEKIEQQLDDTLTEKALEESYEG